MNRVISYNIDQKINTAIVQLRKQKHRGGIRLITDEDVLPESQAYMEYADGHIDVVEFSKDFRTYTFVKTLNKSEVRLIQEKYRLVNA